MYWVDASGATWGLDARWTLLDGRLTLVGLDIRGFRGQADGTQEWLDGQPAELTQRVLRGIPISRVREETRGMKAAAALRNAQLVSQHAQSHPDMAEVLGTLVSDYTELAEAYTAKGKPRKRLPAASSGLLDQVARLYLAAVAAGDKAPARTIEPLLRDAGWPVNPPPSGRHQVRKWIQRARERGLIPPVNDTP